MYMDKIIIKGARENNLKNISIFPATHFVTSKDKMDEALKRIKEELDKQLAELHSNNKLLEEQRLRERTNYDIEMLNVVCKAVDIPVIASGGCGSIQDIVDVFEKTKSIIWKEIKENEEEVSKNYICYETDSLISFEDTVQIMNNKYYIDKQKKIIADFNKDGFDDIIATAWRVTGCWFW